MPSQISKKIKTFSDEELQTKIRRGRAWLIAHSQDKVISMGETYDPERWEKNLQLYEVLSDEASIRGYSESSCWSFNMGKLTFDQLTAEEKWLSLKGDKYLSTKS